LWILAKLLGVGRKMTKHTVILGNSEKMDKIANSTIHLIVTSPPYPMIPLWDRIFMWWCEEKSITKDSFDKMHKKLRNVWEECFRVLIDGGMLCINIGDAARSFDSKFTLFPNHSKVMEDCISIGFIPLPYIIWKKIGEKPYSFIGSIEQPTNLYIPIECEFVLLFRKGGVRKFSEEELARRRLSSINAKERVKNYCQFWDITAERQTDRYRQSLGKLAVFPQEIPERLIKLFSIIGDTVLDPFLGTGTTMAAARLLKRNSIGYEVNKKLIGIIKKKVGFHTLMPDDFEVIETKNIIYEEEY
jgi:site-specific DNA-methyltransferase (cytosine-N4-specific)